jgi:hypothetical protein
MNLKEKKMIFDYLEFDIFGFFVFLLKMVSLSLLVGQVNKSNF